MNGREAASERDGSRSEQVLDVAESRDDLSSERKKKAISGKGEVLYLWMSRREICELLGIPSDQLMQLVDAGDVACDLSGQTPRYRLLRRVTTDAPRKWPVFEFPSPAACLGAPPPRNAVQPDYLSALINLVDQLSQQLYDAERRLARAEQARNEAIDMAYEIDGNTDALVEQLNAYCQSLASTSCALQETLEARNILHRQLETMYVELRAIADSPLAFPIRNRLRSLAEGAKPLSVN